MSEKKMIAALRRDVTAIQAMMARLNLVNGNNWHLPFGVKFGILKFPLKNRHHSNGGESSVEPLRFDWKTKTWKFTTNNPETVYSVLYHKDDIPQDIEVAYFYDHTSKRNIVIAAACEVKK